MPGARGRRSELAVSPEQGEVGEEGLGGGGGGLGELPRRQEWLEPSVHDARWRDAAAQTVLPTGDGEVEVGGCGGRVTFFKLLF